MSKIRVAIAGVGNCASAFIQGLQFYKTHDDLSGLLYSEICGYRVSDILPVAAFDVDEKKVGKDLSEAIYAEPNCTTIFQEVPKLGVPVMMGPVLDGVPKHLRGFISISNKKAVEIGKILRETKADVLLNLLPTGSTKATKAYADAAIKDAKIAFINCIPEMIACDPTYMEIASENGVPLIGDDIKSQIGTTILHRALITTLNSRGIMIDRMYQYNYAGNTDFANLEVRGESKEATKLAALESELPYAVIWGFAPMFIKGQDDTKTGAIFIKGRNFGSNPIRLEVRIEVNDSANAAGVIVDMVRFAKVALDRGLSGPIESVCAYYAKRPPVQIQDHEAKKLLHEFISKK